MSQACRAEPSIPPCAGWSGISSWLLIGNAMQTQKSGGTRLAAYYTITEAGKTANMAATDRYPLLSRLLPEKPA